MTIQTSKKLKIIFPKICFQLYAFRERHPPIYKSDTTFYTNLILDVEANVKWVETEGPALKEWLLDHQPTGLDVEMSNKRSLDLPNSAMEHWAEVRQSYLSDGHQF